MAHLLIKTDEPIIDIIRGVSVGGEQRKLNSSFSYDIASSLLQCWKNFKSLNLDFTLDNCHLVCLDSSENSFCPRYVVRPENTAREISERGGLSGKDLTLLWTNDNVHTALVFNSNKDFFKVSWNV